MIIKGVITTDTKLIEINGDKNFETVGDLIRASGTCKYDGDEYVLISDAEYGNQGGA